MALAGHVTGIFVKAADAMWGAGDEIDGLREVSFSPSREMLDTTDFKDTTAARTRIAGLMDGSISFSGDYESADAPQVLLQTHFASGASLYCWIKWNGTVGHKTQCLVESFEITSSVEGKAEFSCTLQFTGLPAIA
jgi:predicted secreted protein